MTEGTELKVSGIARLQNDRCMIDSICRHFAEHAEVCQSERGAVLRSRSGMVELTSGGHGLSLELTCPSPKALQTLRSMIAEHLYDFAGDEPFELIWSDSALLGSLQNFHEVTVVSTEELTPHMRRVTFACADVTPFIGGDMHVRLLIPPKGRAAVWPRLRLDGRVAWPDGEDELLVRVYTIRGVDMKSRTVWIDFLQHATLEGETPGADFARDAQPGERIALLGPGGGSLPLAQSLLLAGDESALPAIARIAAEMPPATQIQAIIEVWSAQDEQPLASAASLDIRWLHRGTYPAAGKGVLAAEVGKTILSATGETFIWFAGEKDDVRAIRALLRDRGRDRKNSYIAAYWTRNTG